MCVWDSSCVFVSRRVGIVTFRTPRGSLEGIQKGGEKTRKMSNFFSVCVCICPFFILFLLRLEMSGCHRRYSFLSSFFIPNVRYSHDDGTHGFFVHFWTLFEWHMFLRCLYKELNKGFFVHPPHPPPSFTPFSSVVSCTPSATSASWSLYGPILPGIVARHRHVQILVSTLRTTTRAFILQRACKSSQPRSSVHCRESICAL